MRKSTFWILNWRHISYVHFLCCFCRCMIIIIEIVCSNYQSLCSWLTVYIVWCIKCIENTFGSIEADLMRPIFEQQKWNKHVSYHLKVESCHYTLYIVHCLCVLCMHGKQCDQGKYGFCYFSLIGCHSKLVLYWK